MPGEDKEEKVQRPKKQLTDVSGVRIIVFFESDVKAVANIIENTFHVDHENSLDQDSLLSASQVGYRSVHYVCDLGEKRVLLPEFEGLAGLKFEFQIRTVLQHAWAELAHDRNYKFSGILPRQIERKLYLYAGMLEIADKGFSELSAEIDNYIAESYAETERGNLDYELNSLNLEQFVRQWVTENELSLKEYNFKDGFNDLIKELNSYGVTNVRELNDIIPNDYAREIKKFGRKSTIYGFVRDWMIVNDLKNFLENVEVDWFFAKKDMEFLEDLLSPEECALLLTKVGWDPTEHSE
ncbi:GTP pyrophosphokinase [Mesorhizobium sp. C264A]|uniref:GTP pyrophosphokinase n=1 Tax=Mesorhizobium sp. C264A TaxID=2956825 RepID=UPI003336E621